MKPKGKRSLSDKLTRRPKPDNDVRRNPFELFLTKAKHVVAGRNNKPIFNGDLAGKFQKKKKGKPGQGVQVETQGLRSVSRNVALNHRKNTLLTEYKTRTKSNKMMDRRLGEKDATMTIEDKMMERVMFERKQSAKTKKSLFNLNNDDDDEDLHFGQTLAEEERIDVSDEEEDRIPDEEGDILGEKFVSEHHFGGGLLKKAQEGTEVVRYPTQVKADRNILIDDIIAESKQNKYAKQSELDEIRDMTKSLDEKWSDVDVRKLIFSSFSQASAEPPVESYDSLVKLLQFDPKAKASNKLKSDSELAKEAKDELEKAEKNRLKSAHDASNGLELLDPEIEEDSANESDNDDIELDEEVEIMPEVSLPPSEIDAVDRSTIPFVIPVPEKRKQLETLFANRSSEEIATIVKRILQYHHISLAEENRGKLTKFFRLIVDFALTFCDERPVESVELWKLLSPSLVELFLISREDGGELIKSRLEALAGIICKKSNYILVPSAVFFLKFIGLCYPPAYSTHPIISAWNLLLGKTLGNVNLDNRKSFLIGLFIATLVTDNAVTSKKYFPELIHHIRRVISSELQRKEFSTDIADLERKCSIRDVIDGDVGKTSEKDGIMGVCLTLGLLEKLIPTYAVFPAYSEIFGGFLEQFGQLRNRQYTESFFAKLDNLTKLIAYHRHPRPFLTFKKKKPVALKLLDPKIDVKFDRSKSSKKSEIKRLSHDKKRAVKGAKRELRRDNQFLARVQLDEQSKKDAVRQKKVKEIFTGLYSQESEHKAMQRQKAKFKI